MKPGVTSDWAPKVPRFPNHIFQVPRFLNRVFPEIRILQPVLLCACLFFISCSTHSVDYLNKQHKSEAMVFPLQFNEEIHNFGRLKAGETVVFDFIFVNPVKKKLKITKIETGCACLTVTTENGYIKPGKKGILKAVFNTAGLYGNQFQTFSADVSGKRVELAVMAEVINENIQLINN